MKDKTEEVGMVNSYIFNNYRINEFENSVNLRLSNEKKMDEVKDKVIELSEKLEGNDLLEDVPIMAPLKYFKEKQKEKKEKEKEKREKEKEK